MCQEGPLHRLRAMAGHKNSTTFWFDCFSWEQYLEDRMAPCFARTGLLDKWRTEWQAANSSVNKVTGRVTVTKWPAEKLHSPFLISKHFRSLGTGEDVWGSRLAHSAQWPLTLTNSLEVIQIWVWNLKNPNYSLSALLFRGNISSDICACDQ